MNGIVKQEMIDVWMNIQKQQPNIFPTLPPSYIFDEELKRQGEQLDEAYQEKLIKEYAENCYVDIRMHVFRKQIKKTNTIMNTRSPGNSSTKTNPCAAQRTTTSTSPKSKTTKRASSSRPKPTAAIKFLAVQRAAAKRRKHDPEQSRLQNNSPKTEKSDLTKALHRSSVIS